MAHDWSKLEEVHRLARECGVGFSMVYEEAADQFRFSVNSASREENFMGRSRGFNAAVASCLDFLRKLEQ